MSLPTFDGLKSAAASSASVVAALVGQAIKALSIELTQTTGNNAVLLDNAGARVKFSSGGTTDFLSSDGATKITTGGDFAVTGLATFNGSIVIPSGQVIALNGHNTIYGSTPTISSGFGGSPSISGGASALCFQVNVGSGGVATSGVIGLPLASTGWIVLCNNMSSMSATVCVTRQTASSNSSATIGNFSNAGAGGAWNANDIINCIAVGF